MRTWIVTGGAGFIGCHAASRFHAAGDRVVVVDNLSRRGAEANLAWLRGRGLDRLRQADVRDAEADAAGSSPRTPTPTPCSTWPRRSPSPPAWPTPATTSRSTPWGPSTSWRPSASRPGPAGGPLQLDEQGLRQPRARPRRRARRPLRLCRPARGRRRGGAAGLPQPVWLLQGMRRPVRPGLCPDLRDEDRLVPPDLRLRHPPVRHRGPGVGRLVLPGGDLRPAVHRLRRRQADPRRAVGRRPDRRVRAGPGPDRRGLRRGLQHRRRAGATP